MGMDFGSDRLRRAEQERLHRRRIGDRLGENERAQRAMQKQIDSAPVGDENEVAIKHTVELLENGWALSEVTEICDLIHGEVAILQNLTRHQNQDAA